MVLIAKEEVRPDQVSLMNFLMTTPNFWLLWPIHIRGCMPRYIDYLRDIAESYEKRKGK